MDGGRSVKLIKNMIYIKSFIALIANHLFEFLRFIKYSNVFSVNSEQKLKGKITFRYHSIEKGLINNPLRYKFGAAKIERLLFYLKLWKERGYSENDTQFLSACTVLQNYWLLHKEKGIEINSIIPDKDLQLINLYANKVKGGTIEMSSNMYFLYSNASFEEFSISRHSVRHFNGHIISNEIVYEVIKLARHAPSVCNRQGFKAKLINNDRIVKKALEIQGGLNTTAHTVKQLLIVSVDRSIFVSTSEWYQPFIDGGIFLQNLLYSLHYYKIAAVALNWSKHFYLDRKIEKIINMPKSEKIIALIAIGYPVDDFKVPQSARKEVNEILNIID
jgi:nitroreductase